MTHQDDEIDIDDDHEDIEDGDNPSAGATMKEVWDSNPLMKIAAVILGLALLGGGVATFMNSRGDDEDAIKSLVDAGTGSNVKTIAAAGDVDEVYRKALEEENKARAEAALKSQGSAMPTPIGAPKSTEIELPVAPSNTEEDPLKEWRSRNEARRLMQEAEAPPEEDVGVGAPAIVPLVQPVRPQTNLKMNPEAAAQLAEQMRALIETQVPLEGQVVAMTDKRSHYEDMLAEQEAQLQAARQAGTGGSGFPGLTDKQAQAAEKELIVTAGTIAYAQVLNNLNSDVPGPVLAQMLSGPFAGGRAIGTFSVEDEFLVLTFKTIIKDRVSYTVDGIAMDEKTSLTAVVDDVDHHYFKRILLPAAASFIEGYSSAVAETGTSVQTTAGGGQSEETPEPSATEQLYTGLEEAAGVVSGFLQQEADVPITVKLNKGTTFGILFVSPVTTEDAER